MATIPTPYPYISIFGRSPEYADEICQNNQKVSPLLHLPAELCNKIFHYAMEISQGVVRMRRFDDSSFRLVVRTDTTPFRPHSLNYTSRQLRAETKLLRYTMNTYEVDICRVGTLVELLPQPVLDTIRVLRMWPWFFGEHKDLDKEPQNYVDGLTQLVQLPNLKRIVLLYWRSDGDGWGRTTVHKRVKMNTGKRVKVGETQRARVKEVVVELTGKDVEVDECDIRME